MKNPGRGRIIFDRAGRANISRNCPDTIAYLDACMDRLPNQMVWEPRPCFDKGRSLDELHPLFERNAHCYIVGKGRSADKLTASNFPTNDPIIGINEAVCFMEDLELINPVLGVRQDIAIGVDITPKEAIMVVGRNLVGEYYDYPNTYFFDMVKDFGLDRSLVSVFVAVCLAKKMGVRVITLYGFDSFTVKDVQYGDMANPRNKSANNMHLLNQRDQIQYVNKGVKLRWVLPDLENYLTDV